VGIGGGERRSDFLLFFAGKSRGGAMSQPLHVLVIEDSENDAALLELELERAGYYPEVERVELPEELSEALDRRKWDLVIADYVLPHFNGLAALALVKQKGLDMPFIIVSGHITDDTAVAAMKAGAHDYVMKDNLARLGSAVRRELREAEVRQEQRRSEERLKVEHRFREAIENSVPSGIAAVDLEGRQTYVNPAFCSMVGWAEEELVGSRPPFLYWPPEEIDSITNALEQVIQGSSPASGVELRFRRRTNERIEVLLQVTPLRDNFGNVTGWVSSASDITERKRAEIRLAAEHAITRILSNAQTLEEAAPGIVQVLLDGLEVDIGALWKLDVKHQALQLSVMTLRSLSPQFKAFQDASRRLNITNDQSLPGTVWQRRKPVWMSDLGGLVDQERRELAAKAELHSALAFPIHSGDDFFGVLEFFAIRPMEQDGTLQNMMSAIGSEIGQFIQRRKAEEALRRANDELETRVFKRTADLKTANAKLQTSISERKRLEHELLEITEKERRRIGLDLHDDLGQKLSGIAMMTKGLELKLAKNQSTGVEDAAKIHELVQEAMNHASDLAHDLATLDVAERNLAAALEELADHVKELFKISCRFEAEGETPALDATIINQLYKIAQEAVTNAIKHGKARKVVILLQSISEGLVLNIQNDGKPFPDLNSQNTGMGLRIMNYRASLIGASLEIKGTGESGTRVSCSLPLEGKTNGVA
jgi:PAS domain S-box-containing protein